MASKRKDQYFTSSEQPISLAASWGPAACASVTTAAPATPARPGEPVSPGWGARAGATHGVCPRVGAALSSPAWGVGFPRRSHGVAICYTPCVTLGKPLLSLGPGFTDCGMMGWVSGMCPAEDQLWQKVTRCPGRSRLFVIKGEESPP